MDLDRVKVKDIMQSSVIKVTRDMTLKDLAKLFESERISGAPVVEDGHKLVGVVSRTDLVRYDATHMRADETVNKYFQEGELPDDSDDPQYGAESETGDALEQKTVEDIMTPWTISAQAKTPVREVAHMMIDRHIHRVFVTDASSKLKGIVTTMDLIRLMVK